MDSETLNLLTYNIHLGRHVFTRRDAVSKVLDVLRTSQSDVLCLQEVWQPHKDIRHQLEDHCATDWKFQAYAKACAFPKGSQGNAILSRWDILKTERIDISVEGNQGRSFVHAELVSPLKKKKVSVVCVHLGLGREERRQQVETLVGYLESNTPTDEPLIVAGDFNDWLKDLSPRLWKKYGLKEALLAKTGHHARTYPAFCPVLPLDRIYYKNCSIQEARLLKNRFYVEPSDHVPIHAVIKI